MVGFYELILFMAVWEPCWLQYKILQSLVDFFMGEEVVGDGEQLSQELMGQRKQFLKQQIRQCFSK